MSRNELIGILVTCIVVAVTVAVVVRVSEVDNVGVTFPDVHLEAAIREAIDIPEGPLYAQHLAGLASLSASARNITSLTGLECCTGLTELLFQENEISDVSPLVGNLGLGEGDYLDLRFNPLSEESVNEYIPELEARGVDVLYDMSEAGVYFADPTLEAEIRQAIDKSAGPIYPSDLQGLTELNDYGSNITDLTGLECCTSLTKLRLRENRISDISPLAGLSGLTAVHLNHNLITDISALAGLSGLTGLNLGSNRICDISPLVNLAELRQLDLHDNQISNCSVLAQLTNLTLLELHYNEISEISPLVDNPGLHQGASVDLRDNPLSQKSLNVHIPELEARGVNVDY